jgi:hypothetical protein
VVIWYIRGRRRDPVPRIIPRNIKPEHHLVVMRGHGWRSGRSEYSLNFQRVVSKTEACPDRVSAT